MMLDLRSALRALSKAPAFAAGAVLTLAVALGLVMISVSLLFGAIGDFDRSNASDPMVLSLIERVEGRDQRMRWPYPAIEIARTRLTSFDRIATYTAATLNVSYGAAEAERVDTELASSHFFEVLGIAPALGRPFSPTRDERIPGPDEILISDALWQRAFGAAPDAIGRTVRLSRRPVTVVGVLPPGFRGLSGRADVIAPHSLAPVVSFRDYFASQEYFHNVIARRAPGVSIEQARSELAAIVPVFAEVVPARSDNATHRGADAVTLTDARTDPQTIRARVLIALGASFVLLIAAVNVANLVVARVAARQREFALRLAVGATRVAVFRAVAVEMSLITAAGLGVAVIAASWARDLVASLVPPGIATPSNDYGQLATLAGMELNTPAVMIVAVLALLVMVLVSMFACRPLFSATLSNLMKRGGRVGSGPGTAQRLLLTAQVAISIALLASAGLLFRTVEALGSVDPGFNPRNVIAFSVAEDVAVRGPAVGPALAERLLNAIRRVPGVASASVGQCAPFGARCARLPLRLENTRADAGAPTVGWHRVGPDHFAALEIPVLRGRGFTADDRLGRPAVVVINEEAAKRFFSNREPLGQRLRLPEVVPGEPEVAEIVGVVGNVLYWPVDEPPGPDVYQPSLQFSYPWTTVMVRTAHDPATAVADLRQAIREADPNLPLYDIATLDDLGSAGRADREFLSVLLAVCALLGVTLAVIGVYAMTASWMTARRRELGVRMALGAAPDGLVRLVIGATLWQTMIGLAIGTLMAIAAGRLLGALLFGVAPHDPRTMMMAATAMLVASLLAAYLPARRALRLDPVRELSAE
jgi:putative ABC transport system permease protein